MNTVNSVSGGKSSAYIYANFPTSLNIFSLVRIENPKFLWMRGKDEKTRQIISDRINKEFVGTAEMDTIIYTILDLEQHFGHEIIILSPITFEDLIRDRKGFLPSPNRRFCTTELKIEPIFKYLYSQNLLPVMTRIGYRQGEEIRRDKAIARLSPDGFEYMYKRTTQKPNSRYFNREHVKYRKICFPLIENNIDENLVNQYWLNKKIRFAPYNNCAGCVNRSPLFHNTFSKNYAHDYNVFIYLEQYANEILKSHNIEGSTTFRPDGTMHEFANPQIDFGLFASDFNDCDSGYCHD